MKRAKTSMTKPTGRVPRRVGAILLKEAPYKDRWIVDASWRGADTPSGRGHATFPNWPRAEEFAAKENKRLDVLKEKGAGRFTFNDAVDSFIKERERISKSKDNSGCTLDTLYGNQGIIENHLRPKFGSMRLAQISSRDIKDWLISQGEVAQPRTIKTRLATLKIVLNHAIEREMLHALPQGLNKLRTPGKILQRAKIPDRSDLEKLREYLMGPRPVKHERLSWSCTRMIVLLAMSCAMRAGEAAALQWDDIDRETGEITINKARSRLQGLKGPKTEAGYRKIPTTPAARAIINEHAEVYKEHYGKCVGSVLRSRYKDYLDPTRVSGLFNEAMRACGLVDPNTNQIKFAHHASRHWGASHWVKSTGDIHQVKKWLGHKNASMTLDIYGHCLDDPEAREKFLRIPDWLAPVQETESLSAPRPVEITEPPRALPAPEDSFEFGPKVVNGSVEPDCPMIDVPNIAEPWVKPFIESLYRGTKLMEAYREIRLLIPRTREGTSPHLNLPDVKERVRQEFARLKLPLPKTLMIRFREQKIFKLHSEKHQVLDIARKVGVDQSLVHQVLRSRHKGNAHNPLNYKIYRGGPKTHQPQPEHKTQLKLL